MKEYRCYQFELDFEGVLSGRPSFRYVIATSLEEATKLVEEKKYWQRKIAGVKVCGFAITSDSEKE